MAKHPRNYRLSWMCWLLLCLLASVARSSGNEFAKGIIREQTASVTSALESHLAKQVLPAMYPMMKKVIQEQMVTEAKEVGVEKSISGALQSAPIFLAAFKSLMIKAVLFVPGILVALKGALGQILISAMTGAKLIEGAAKPLAAKTAAAKAAEAGPNAASGSAVFGLTKQGKAATVGAIGATMSNSKYSIATTTAKSLEGKKTAYKVAAKGDAVGSKGLTVGVKNSPKKKETAEKKSGKVAANSVTATGLTKAGKLAKASTPVAFASKGSKVVNGGVNLSGALLSALDAGANQKAFRDVALGAKEAVLAAAQLPLITGVGKMASTGGGGVSLLDPLGVKMFLGTEGALDVGGAINNNSSMQGAVGKTMGAAAIAGITKAVQQAMAGVNVVLPNNQLADAIAESVATTAKAAVAATLKKSMLFTLDTAIGLTLKKALVTMFEELLLKDNIFPTDSMVSPVDAITKKFKVITGDSPPGGPISVNPVVKKFGVIMGGGGGPDKFDMLKYKTKFFVPQRVPQSSSSSSPATADVAMLTTTTTTAEACEFPSFVARKMDIVIVLESSVSISQAEFELLRPAAVALYAGLATGGTTKVAVVQYGGGPMWTSNFSDHGDVFTAKEELMGMVRMEGDGSVEGAIQLAVQSIFTAENPKSRHGQDGVSEMMLVITTGEKNPMDAITAASDFKARGGVIGVVGIGSLVNFQLMGEMGSEGLLFGADRYSDLLQLTWVIQVTIIEVTKETSCEHTTTTTAAPVVMTTAGSMTTTTAAKKRQDSCLLDLNIVLDSSDNYTEHEFNTQVKRFLWETTDQLNVAVDATHVSMVQFSDFTTRTWNYLDYRSAEIVRAAVEQLTIIPEKSSLPRSARLFRAMEYSSFFVFSSEVNDQTRSDDPRVANVMMVVTTGNYTGANPVFAAASFRRHGGIVVAVGIGPTINRMVINEIATPGYAYIVDSADEISNIASAVATSLLPAEPCQEESTTTTKEKPEATTTTTTTAGADAATITTDSAATIASCGEEVNNKFDIAFVVDSSNNFTPEQFENAVVPLIVNMEKHLDIGEEKTRVAMLQYSWFPVMRWNFMRYLTNFRLERETGFMQHNGGGANLHKAIMLVDRSFFSNTTNGLQSRVTDPTVTSVMIIVTQGASQDELDPVTKAEKFRGSGGVVVAVSIGPQADAALTEQIATPGFAFVFPDFSNIEEKARQVMRRLIVVTCNNKTTTTPPSPEEPTTTITTGDGSPGTPPTRPVTITPTSDGCQMPKMDVGFVFDSSSGYRESTFEDIAKPLAVAVLGGLDVGRDESHVAMLQYSLWPYRNWNFNDYTTVKQLQAQTAQLQYHGGINFLFKGIELADFFVFESLLNSESRARRGDVKEVMIIVSSGKFDIVDPTGPAKAFRSHGLVVAIGVGAHANVELIEKLASPGHSFMVANEEQVEAVAGAVIQSLHTDDCIATTTTAGPDGTTTKTTVTDGSTTTTTTAATTTSTTTSCELPMLDVAFVLDSSDTFSRARFISDITPFIASVQAELEMSPGNTHAAVVQFSGYPLFSINFDSYTSLEELQKQTRALKYLGGPSNVRRGIKYADWTVLSTAINPPSRGGQASELMVVFTDGTFDFNNPIAAARTFKERGGAVVVVAAGPNIVHSVVEAIASPGMAFMAQDFADLPNIPSQIKAVLLPPGCSLTATPSPATVASYYSPTNPVTTRTTTAESSTTTTTANPGTTRKTRMKELSTRTTTKTTKELSTKTTITENPGTTSKTTMTPPHCIYDVALVLDSSNNYSTREFNEVLVKFISAFESEIGVPSFSRLAMIEFANRPKQKWNFNDYLDVPSLQAETAKLKKHGGIPAISRAIEFVDDVVMNNTVNGQSRSQTGQAVDVMVIVTEGNWRGEDPAVAATKFKNGGGLVIAVGFGPGVKPGVIANLASPGQAHVLADNDYALALTNIVDYLFPSNQCDRSTTDPLSETTTTTKPSTTTTTTTTTTETATRISTRVDCSHPRLDVGFLVDSSSSFTKDEFKKDVIGVVQAIQQLLNVSKESTHVAMSQYTMFSLPTWNFDSYTEKAELLEATEGLPYFGGASNNSQAVHFKSQNVFSGNAQVRADAQNVMILITNGHRTENDLFIQEAKNFKDNRGVIVGIGLGPNVKTSTIKQVASPGKAFVNRDYSNVGLFAQDIVNSILPPRPDYCATTTKTTEAMTTTTSTTIWDN
eukprot:GHVS01069604.1.p1 GENE.GHVS01069604.1~~GHVS01069604.1.p1  ORF type:complete len:2194 (+),score=424.31 GHVS01069604.1:371-6952(+)